MNPQTPAPHPSQSDTLHPGALSPSARPAIFVDRDGTLMEDTGYPRHPDEVRLFPGVCEALRALQQLGYAVIIISNQSGVGRGMITLEQAQSVHQRLEQCLVAGGVRLDGAYYCYDSPDAASDLRKPGIGMLLHAQRELGLQFRGSFMIGDKSSDMEAGRNAGCQTILFRPAFGAAPSGGADADHVASSWDEILRTISKYGGE